MQTDSTIEYRRALARLYRQAVMDGNDLRRRALAAQIEEELGLWGLVEVKLLAVSLFDVASN